MNRTRKELIDFKSSNIYLASLSRRCSSSSRNSACGNVAMVAALLHVPTAGRVSILSILGHLCRASSALVRRHRELYFDGLASARRHLDWSSQSVIDRRDKASYVILCYLSMAIKIVQSEGKFLSASVALRNWHIALKLLKETNSMITYLFWLYKKLNNLNKLSYLKAELPRRVRLGLFIVRGRWRTWRDNGRRICQQRYRWRWTVARRSRTRQEFFRITCFCTTSNNWKHTQVYFISSTSTFSFLYHYSSKLRA